MEGMGHYGVYRERFQEVMELELAWLKKALPERVVGGPSD
jgi:hypothetical protein